MQLLQKTLDEHLLWEYLQTEQWGKSIELIDSYYSGFHENRFDDPQIIKKADFIPLNEDSAKSISLPIHIRRNQKSFRFLLIILGLVYAFFGYLSFEAGSIIIMLIPAILFPIVPIAIYNLIKRTVEITLTEKHIEFRKSRKEPIRWNNILAIYHYHRGTGPIYYPGMQAADFIIIWKKDAVKPEQYYLNYMDRKPVEIIHLINYITRRIKNEF